MKKTGNVEKEKDTIGDLEVFDKNRHVDIITSIAPPLMRMTGKLPKGRKSSQLKASEDYQE